MTPKGIEHEADLRADLAECANNLELIVSKQRNGPCGTAQVWCDMACNVFTDFDDPRLGQNGRIAA